ncbi:MAG: imidazolonepropionase [Bacteroidota bacterium]
MQLIGPFKQLLAMNDLPIKGKLQDEDLPVVEQAGILIKDGRVEKIDEFEKLYKNYKEQLESVEEIKGDLVALPGFIDAHTHICFSGSRAKDYAMRNGGKSYLEIAREGGGIWDTVTKTRAASQADLIEGILQRIKQLLNNGITTIEVKSGYGLSVEEEYKMLKAIQLANKSTFADLIPTCLAAHIFPKDYDGTITDYLVEISEKLFPKMIAENLGNRVDAFIEEEAFSAQIVAPYFQKAKSLGFDLTVHADQFHTSGSEVAVNFEAVSADHLEASSGKEIELLAKSKVIPVALPGASIGLGCDFTPARKLLDLGASLAIASDWNPGSAPMGDLLTQAAILGTFEKLSNAEVLAGITFRAAAALRLNDRGRLEKGKLADIVAFPADHFNEILYHQGQLKPSQTWKQGKGMKFINLD